MELKTALNSHQLRRQLCIDSNLSNVDFQITLSRPSRSSGDPNASRRVHHTWYSKPWLSLCLHKFSTATDSTPPRCLLKFDGYPRTSSNLSSCSCVGRKILLSLRRKKSHMELHGASKFPPSASTNMKTQSSIKQPYKSIHSQWTAHSPDNIGWCQIDRKSQFGQKGLITWHAVG